MEISPFTTEQIGTGRLAEPHETRIVTSAPKKCSIRPDTEDEPTASMQGFRLGKLHQVQYLCKSDGVEKKNYFLKAEALKQEEKLTPVNFSQFQIFFSSVATPGAGWSLV